MCYRYDGNSVHATIAARLMIKNRMMLLWKSQVNLTKIVRRQFGTKCDGSGAANTRLGRNKHAMSSIRLPFNMPHLRDAIDGGGHRCIARIIEVQ